MQGNKLVAQIVEHIDGNFWNAWLVAIQHTLCKLDRAADPLHNYDTKFAQQATQHIT